MDLVKEVSFWSCHIGDSGVKTLMKYLACGKGDGTWKFDMTGSNINEEGAASIAEVLHSSGVMNSLELLSNPIGAGGLQSIAEAQWRSQGWA